MTGCSYPDPDGGPFEIACVFDEFQNP
jgi:hypothetical protein